MNGWQVGNYVNYLGPQHSFPVPNGILNPNGRNTIAIAVWNLDGTTGGLGTGVADELRQLRLVAAGRRRTPARATTRRSTRCRPRRASTSTSTCRTRCSRAGVHRDRHGQRARRCADGART